MVPYLGLCHSQRPFTDHSDSMIEVFHLICQQFYVREGFGSLGDPANTETQNDLWLWTAGPTLRHNFLSLHQRWRRDSVQLHTLIIQVCWGKTEGGIWSFLCLFFSFSTAASIPFSVNNQVEDGLEVCTVILTDYCVSLLHDGQLLAPLYKHWCFQKWLNEPSY